MERGSAAFTSDTTFCPDIIFTRLDNYITQVQTLDNIQVLNPRKIASRTLGSISISERLGQKDIEIEKDGLVLYKAKKTTEWRIVELQLNIQQIQSITNLPQTQEQILTEFYGRKLTHKLKKLFQLKNYPVNKPVSLNHAQVPYNFWLDTTSNQNKIIFVGSDAEDNIVFRSSFSKEGIARVIEIRLCLEHTNQLCSSDP